MLGPNTKSLVFHMFLSIDVFNLALQEILLVGNLGTDNLKLQDQS